MGYNYKVIALGVGVVGAIGVNIAQYATQKMHRSRDYCQLPLKSLENNTSACELLGGKPIKILKLDLSQAHFNPQKAKLIMPVKGKKRGGFIYTLSTRSSKESEWILQYAVMKIAKGDFKWNVWLYPDNGTDSNTDLLPDDVQKSLM